jgi:hypothetical protein
MVCPPAEAAAGLHLSLPSFRLEQLMLASVWAQAVSATRVVHFRQFPLTLFLLGGIHLDSVHFQRLNPHFASAAAAAALCLESTAVLFPMQEVWHQAALL